MLGQGLQCGSAESGALLRAQAVLRDARQRALGRDAPSDARWVLAAAVFGALEGGRAAVLRPGRRQRINRLASGLGLRPFDAALIIAIAQDAARRGEAVGSQGVMERLRLVGQPVEQQRLRGGLIWGLGGAMGVLMAVGVIGWVLVG